MVYRVFVEKKPGVSNENVNLLSDFKEFLGVKGLTDIKIWNRYDAENITKELFDYSVKTVFSEPQIDIASEEINTDGATVFAVEYLPGVEFAKKGATWAGATTPYYWPKTGSMLFAGYSPVDFAGVTFTLASNKFSVAECPQPEFSATKDLLYAGYTTSVLGGTAPMTFSHALSWVTVKAKAAAANQIKITNIKFVGLAEKGYSAGLPAWTVSGTKDQLNVFAPTSAFAVPAAETLVESNENCGLVFPQALENAAEIVVSYEMNNGAGQWFAQAPFVQKLNSLKSGTDTINKWEAGKHYTYIINFSTIAGGPDSSNEITIAPTVNDWTPVTADGISAN